MPVALLPGWLTPAFARFPVADHALELIADTQRIVRSTTHANLSERLPCAATPKLELHDFTSMKRKDWREPRLSELPCFPGHCFRGVFDGMVQIDRHNESRWNEEVLAVLQAEFAVDPSAVTVSTQRRKTYVPTTLPKPNARLTRVCSWPSPYEELHADYYESERYVFTAVLFFGEEEADMVRRVGGETALLDEMRRDDDGACQIARGLVVEPKAGRLLVFSGGGENYHVPIAVEAGRRSTYHVWFQCAPAFP